MVPDPKRHVEILGGREDLMDLVALACLACAFSWFVRCSCPESNAVREELKRVSPRKGACERAFELITLDNRPTPLGFVAVVSQWSVQEPTPWYEWAEKFPGFVKFQEEDESHVQGPKAMIRDHQRVLASLICLTSL